ncbi:MAG: siderophore ABC transporter substrate-binding protein [Neisseriaceae bacterium]|nr:siderophore ABC transporter substrate-binding protein [Neisseriaceae bacterium]
MTRYLLSLLCAAALAACSQQPATPTDTTEQAATQTVTIATARGDATVQKSPKRVAVFDWAALDTLNQMGVKVGATTAKVLVDYLAPVFQDTLRVGTLFEPDYETLHDYKPQLIITGGPGATEYDQLAELAPTVDLTIDNHRIRESALERMDALAAIFDKQDVAQRLKAEINASFAQTRAAAKNKGTAMVVSITGHKVYAFGPESRMASWIHKDLGMPPADAGIDEKSGHGMLVSFEYIRQQNPDWIFVLDRTAAIGEEGPPAKNVLDNPIVAKTTAWEKDQVIVMPSANYIVAGGVQQLLQASKQLRDAFQASK